MNEFVFRNPFSLDDALQKWVKQTQATVFGVDDPWRKLVGFATVVPERLRLGYPHQDVHGGYNFISFTVLGELCNETHEPLNPSAHIFTEQLPEVVWFWIKIKDLARAYVSQGQRIEYRDWQLATIRERQERAFFCTFPHGVKGKDAEIIARRELGLL